jgi:hypothetical protein
LAGKVEKPTPVIDGQFDLACYGQGYWLFQSYKIGNKDFKEKDLILILHR